MHLKLQLMSRYVVVSEYLRSPAKKVQAVDDGRLARCENGISGKL